MVKKILRILVIESTVLFVVSQITTGLEFTNGFGSLILTAIALSLASLFVKPIINLLLLPLNLITFGIFRFLTSTITLFIVDLLLTDFAVNAFSLKGYHSNLIIIPSLTLPAGILSYIAFSFLISFTTTAIYWLLN